MAWSAAVLLSLTACQPLELAPPDVRAVEPTYAWNEADVHLRVLGAGFWPEVQVSTTREETPDPDLGTDYRVFLVGPGGAPERLAVDTTWVDTTELSAIVQAGAPPGLYDIEVVTPRGQSAVGERLFTVTDLQPDHLRLTPTTASVVPVTQDVAVAIELYDKQEQRVEIDLPVIVSAGAGTTIEWLGQQPNVLVGGKADITVESEIAQTVTLTATPVGGTETGISDDTLTLTFEPGDEWGVKIELDESAGPPPYVAGTSIPFTAQLVDEHGNAVDGNVSVTLRTNCGTWIADVSLEDGNETPFDVVPDAATSVDVCPEEYVYTLRGPPLGESVRFEVLAGDVDHFQVVASPVLRQAGDAVNVVAEPEDRYGNRTSWIGYPTLSASSGGLLDVSCEAVEELQLCSAQVTVASDPVVIDVVSHDGMISGTSNPIVVVADDVPAILTVTAPGPATAGIPTEVEVRAQDAWGNAIDAATLGADAFVLGDELGDATCEFSTVLGDGAAEYACTFTIARPAAVIEAVASTVVGPAVGTAAPLEVQNGALAVVTVVAPASVTAGAVFTASLIGTDAFGNPYTVQADPIVDLADDTLTFPPAQVTLGPDGAGEAAGSLTLAGATVLRATQAGSELGASGAIVVLAGPGASFTMSPAVPWAFVNEPRVISLQTFDAFGNPADWEGDATLSSTFTSSPDVVIPLTDGWGSGEFTWTSVFLAEVLVAEAEGFSSSLPIVVAGDCGASGPAPSLTLDGFDVGIDCLDPLTDTATFTADLSGSVAGVAAITGYVIGLLGEAGVGGPTATLDVTVAHAGPHPVGGLVVDAARCGAEVFSTAWAGPDDGTPTGPIVLAAQAMELLVFDTVSFDVLGVVDCARQPAAFASVGMRSTAGLLSGPAATGEGLELALDAVGNGTFDVDTNGALEDGLSQVHAFVDSGAARGLLLLPIIGDNIRPVVVQQAPSGEEVGLVGEVRLTFSEPLSPDTALPEHFVVNGPFAVTITSAVLEQGDTEAVLTLSPEADGASGVFTVGALATLADVAGNPLAGTWAPGAAPYVGVFGDVGQPVDAVACPAIDPPGLVFRPDGDPGAGVEADEVAITLDSASAPSWWVMEVHDAAGARRLHDRIPPLGASDTIVWDARGFDGMVVENGSFTITVVPDDGSGNRGAGCTLDVVIDNRTGALP